MIAFKGKQIFDLSILQDKMLIPTASIINTIDTTNKEYVDSIFNIRVNEFNYWADDFNLTANDVSLNNVALATNQPITGLPNGLIKIKLNGINQILGDRNNGDCYFSRNNGFSAVADPDKGDFLYWNANNSLVALDTNDHIDIIYVSTIDKQFFSTQIEYVFNGRGNIYVLTDVTLVPNKNKIVINGVDIWLVADQTSLWWDTTTENYQFSTLYSNITRTYNGVDFLITYDGPIVNTIGQSIGQQFTVEEINISNFSVAFDESYG